MSDITLVVGEEGFDYDITIKNPNGDIVDISDFTAFTLTIWPADFSAQDASIALSTPGDPGVVRWTVATGDIPGNQGMYVGQIRMSDASTIRKTRHLDIRVVRELP